MRFYFRKTVKGFDDSARTTGGMESRQMEGEFPKMAAYQILVRLRTDDRTRSEILGSLLRIAEPARVRPGCLRFGVYQSAEDPDEVTLVEEWRSREAMDGHIRSADFRVVLAAVDLSSKEPEIRFDSVTSSSGLEYLKDVFVAG